ncbi:MAG: hypothetical protein MJE77_12075 [Proteobacteria bacterium]|nr:hypothetical protein [Pseudomonadota bacterium]
MFWRATQDELVEQYHKQVKGTGYGGESSGAHGKGIAAENEVNGTVRGAQKVVRVTQNADRTINAVVEIPYTHPDGRVVTTTLTITENNVTKAEDKVIAAPGDLQLEIQVAQKAHRPAFPGHHIAGYLARQAKS